MKKLAKFILNHQKSIVFFVVVVTLIMAFLSSKIEINPSMKGLLPQDDPYVKVFNEASDNFKGADSIIAVVQGNEKDIKNYIDNIVNKLKKLDGIDSIIDKQPVDFMLKNSYNLANKKDIQFLNYYLGSKSLNDVINSFNVMFGEGDFKIKFSKNEKKQMKAMIDNMNLFFNDIYDPSNADKDIYKKVIIGDKYFISEDNTTGMFFIRPKSYDDINKMNSLVNSIEKVVKDNTKNYNVKAGITGTYVIQRDEMVVSQKDMTRATIVSLLLIVVIFIFGFKALRYTILSIIPLIIGIIWTIGITYILIGSLNIITVMMGVILLGLGIDYSIHIISLYMELKNKKMENDEIIYQIFEKTIPGIISGAVTTAIGFGMFVFSSFDTFKQFGIILFLGIIFTLIITILLMPSMLLKFGKKYKKIKKFHIKRNFLKFKYIYFAIAILVVGVSIFNIKNIKFESNMMKIEAKGLETVRLNKILIDKFDLSSDNTIFISDNLDEARELYKKLENLDTVSLIDSVVDYIPKDQKEKINMIDPISKYSKFDYDLFKKQISQLKFNINLASVALRFMKENELSDKLKELNNNNLFKNINTINVDRLKRAQEFLINGIQSIQIDKGIIKEDNLPEFIHDSYISNSGKILTTVYPSDDIWDMNFQKKYRKDLDNLNNEKYSGTALIFLKVMDIAAKEGFKVLIFTIIGIMAILLIDLKNIKYAIYAILPMILSLITLVGIMGIFGIKFDVINIIAIPLIIGIGVDDGIHLIHRFKKEKNILRALFSTGRAITLTTLTTVSAFGSFMLSDYRGFIGFGFLLSLGIILCYVYTIFILGGLLSLEKKE